MCVLWSHLRRVCLGELNSAVVGWSVLYTPLRFHQAVWLFDFFLLILYPVTLLLSAAVKGPWSPQWNIYPFLLPYLDHIQLPHDTNLSVECGRKGEVPGALVSETSSPSHGCLLCVCVKSILIVSFHRNKDQKYQRRLQRNYPHLPLKHITIMVSLLCHDGGQARASTDVLELTPALHPDCVHLWALVPVSFV